MTNAFELDVIILAAGKGTRMRSQLPRVLHKIAGTSMIEHVVSTASELQPRNTVVVVGHGADLVKAQLPEGVQTAFQAEQNGTGHAVRVGLDAVSDPDVALILYGDVPLICVETLSSAVQAAADGAVGLVTAEFADPGQLGRIVRGMDAQIQKIVEFKDASDEERRISEINSGIMAVPGNHLKRWLQDLKPLNNQGEYYLTDIIEMAVGEGIEVRGITVTDEAEVTGVNDRIQLSELERVFQRRQAQALMMAGVTLADPERLDIRGTVEAGEDCFIDINVVLSGHVVLGSGVSIGPGAVVNDSTLGANTTVHAHTVVDGAHLKDSVSVGPFARIRPGSVLENDVKIGNFVETKKAHLGPNSKASHLAYLGDATIGADCNIGAGAVTCNYDGINKHRTEIGDGVFVGTNATMVAPIQMEDGAFVAAGSTVTTKIGSGELAVGRAKQRNIKGWTRPDKRKS